MRHRKFAPHFIALALTVEPVQKVVKVGRLTVNTMPSMVICRQLYVTRSHNPETRFPRQFLRVVRTILRLLCPTMTVKLVDHRQVRPEVPKHHAAGSGGSDGAPALRYPATG